MIQFFIENQEVILPDDYSFTLIDENPLVTTKGEFSLDITISLRNKQNAKAAKFINRINKIQIDASYNALMIDDFKQKYGTIIIQSHTNVDLSFQFVSGNSELNYLADNGKKIWELDWGSEDAIDYEKAKRSIDYPGYGHKSIPDMPNVSWTQNYVCTPVILGDLIANDYTIDLASINDKIIMQPYLLYYINRLPMLLGYTIKSNMLNDDSRAKKMYVLNAVDSLKYADALPDMTILEFITAIESFFNVSFVVDKIDKTVSIIRLSSNISSKRVVSLKHVLDDYTRDLSQDPKTSRFDYSRVSYDLASDNYFKYNRLSDDILSKCKIENFDYPLTINPDYSNKLVILRENTSKRDYFIKSMYTSTSQDPVIPLKTYGEGNFGVVEVNKFAPYGDSNKNELVLKICPAAIDSTKYFTIPAGQGTSTSPYQLPKSSNDYFIQTEETFIDLIEKSENNIPRTDKIEVALFTGKVKIDKSLNIGDIGSYTYTYYPMSHTDEYTDVFYNHDFDTKATETMRLNGPNNVIEDYQFQKILDTNVEYTFSIPDSLDLVPENLFEYRNILFMPISFERVKKNTKKTGELVTGVFYRML